MYKISLNLKHFVLFSLFKPQTSSSLSDAEMRLRKFMSAAKSTEKRDTSRRDAEVRRQRREIERQMQDEEERVKRKRERSRSRTGKTTSKCVEFFYCLFK